MSATADGRDCRTISDGLSSSRGLNDMVNNLTNIDNYTEYGNEDIIIAK